MEPTLDDNGAIRVSLDRAARWQRAGASVVVLVVEHGLPDQRVDVPPDLDVRQATSRPVRFRWTALLATVALLRLARRADVVVAGREVHMGLLLCHLVRPLHRRPLAVTVQSRPDVTLDAYVDDRWRQRTLRALISSDLAVCVGQGLAPELIGLGMPPQRVRVVSNGVDVQQIRKSALEPAQVELPSSVPFIVGSGRLHRQKGFDVLLRAHARALASGAPPHAVLLLGDGPDRADLGRLSLELGVEDSVHFAGFVANPHAVVNRADLFVLSSRWEGLPLVLVEALALGVPVVSTDCVAGPDEILDRGRYGRLVPVDDVEALADAITDHLRCPARLREAAASAAETAADRFDPQRAADTHLSFLAELVGP